MGFNQTVTYGIKPYILCYDAHQFILLSTTQNDMIFDHQNFYETSKGVRGSNDILAMIHTSLLVVLPIPVNLNKIISK